MSNATLLIITGFLMIGCNPESGLKSDRSSVSNEARTTQTPALTPSPDDSDLVRNIELWNSQRISKYRMKVLQDAHGATRSEQTVIIDVDGEMVSIRPEKEDDTRSLEYFTDVKTVPKLFSEIEKLRKQSWVVQVEYDKKYGYPKSIRGRDPKSNAWWTLKVLRFDAQ